MTLSIQGPPITFTFRPGSWTQFYLFYLNQSSFQGLGGDKFPNSWSFVWLPGRTQPCCTTTGLFLRTTMSALHIDFFRMMKKWTSSLVCLKMTGGEKRQYLCFYSSSMGLMMPPNSKSISDLLLFHFFSEVELSETCFSLISLLFRELRNLVVEMVLATDMSCHFQQIKAMKSFLQQPEVWVIHITSVSVDVCWCLLYTGQNKFSNSSKRKLFIKAPLWPYQKQQTFYFLIYWHAFVYFCIQFPVKGMFLKSFNQTFIIFWSIEQQIVDTNNVFP